MEFDHPTHILTARTCVHGATVTQPRPWRHNMSYRGIRRELGQPEGLRIYRGAENEQTKEQDRLGSGRPPFRLQPDSEDYWSGRLPAARLTTRVAA